MIGFFSAMNSDLKGQRGGPYLCESCEPGTFSDSAGATACSSCGLGTYSTGTLLIMVKHEFFECFADSDLSILLGFGSSTCTLLSMAKHVFFECFADSDLRFLPGFGSSTCTACALPGVAPTAQTTVVPAASSPTQCKACWPGTQNCSGCVPGEYQDAGGQVICLVCPVGHECPNATAKSATPCASGWHADLPGRIKCTPCASGSTSGAGASSCAPCSNASCPLTVNGTCGKVSVCRYSMANL